jgi:hydroxymethylglutaryl-CoA lyase
MDTHTPIVVREVGLRDGLQSIARTLPTAQKLEWLRAAHAAGLREIEVGSFVPARLLPQLADTAALVDAARALRDASSSARGSRCVLEVGLSTAFGCTIQGRVDEAEVLRLVQAVLDAGADRVGLADTVGYADPLQVARVFERCFTIAGDRLACGHFHDTRGLGMANVFAAWQTGVRRFDACTGGIGGCPHAPGASGNVATEDVAYLFASMGVPTGLDIDALVALRGRVGQWLAGEPLHGSIARAGLPKTMRETA